MRKSIIEVREIKMVIINENDKLIRIIKTEWDGVFNVIYEDAYQSTDCAHLFLTTLEIEKKYKLDINGAFNGY